MRPRHIDAAERIITTQGFTFALACLANKQAELAEARLMLKDAIVAALAEEGRLALIEEAERRRAAEDQKRGEG